jgi:hypothetical protein
MHLPGVDAWLKAPADHEVIEQWTVGKGRDMRYELALPEPADPERFEFLVLGDTGDSDAAGPFLSPQDAVAREMAADSIVGPQGRACMVLHLGDIVYMAGERRLYDRNFRRPYAPFLMPESTVDNLVFRIPFLPVPGNHDYYDLSAFLTWFAKVPILGAGLRALAHELFAFSLPEGGSEKGKAFMHAFVDENADTTAMPITYRPGAYTRLPNRYYRMRLGPVDFFALDSNTLDAPPPWTDTDEVKAGARRHIEAQEEKARRLDSELRQGQRELDAWRAEQKRSLAEDSDRRTAVVSAVQSVSTALQGLLDGLSVAEASCSPCGEARSKVEAVMSRWTAAAQPVVAGSGLDPTVAETLDRAGDDGCSALRDVEECLACQPESPVRSHISQHRDALQGALATLSEALAPPPDDLCERIHTLSEEALDVQRDLALARRRARYRPDDYDAGQLQWLKAGLADCLKQRPEGWRVVYMHHPIYTAIGNHCEGADVQAVRGNLLELLRAGEVDLVLTGHAHALEWFRSSLLPHTAILVSGGGGQVTLRRSILEPDQLYRNRDRFEALRAHGALEYLTAGRGPSADDGETGSLYHYLRIEVRPDVLRVKPVGVRRIGREFRREEPMPAYHITDLANGQPGWERRVLQAVEVRKGEPPRPIWDS